MPTQRTAPQRLAIAIAAALAIPTPVTAVNELRQLTPSDPAPKRHLGQSVAIDGNTAIVGAIGAPEAAYIFDVTTGAELFQLNAADNVSGDVFGFSVDISGNTAVVGAMFDTDDDGELPGSAYIFDTTTGIEKFKLAPTDSAFYGFFGISVAIQDNIVIVGAPGDSRDATAADLGAAYIFNAATGERLSKITSADSKAGDFFGVNVAISGNTAIIGTNQADDDAVFAYLFDITDPTAPVERGKLVASDSFPKDSYGSAVAISGNTAILGTLYENDDGDFSGSAYLYDITDLDAPIERAKLTASDTAPGDQFGFSVGISGNTAIVGANLNNNTGAAYFFDITDLDDPIERPKLTASDAGPEDQFGVSVAIDGNTAIVGADFNDTAASDAGAAYVFEVPEPATASLFALILIPTTTQHRRRK